MVLYQILVGRVNLEVVYGSIPHLGVVNLVVAYGNMSHFSGTGQFSGSILYYVTF